MEKPAAQNIQDAFLNSARRERINVVIHLLQGSTLSGRIKSFDKFSVLLDVGGQDTLIFKHSISTISQERKGETASAT
jgi:host factor-I protein